MNLSNRKKILLVTRPLSPPWDEASKNFAYQLARNIKGFQFTILVNKKINGIPENIQQEKIYTSNRFDLKQKHQLMNYLIRMRKSFDIIHYVFTPTKLNSFLIKYFTRHRKAKRIQTIATLREDLFSDKKIKKMIFGDIVITYSDYTKSKLNKLGFKNTKSSAEFGSGTWVKRIYPGINLDCYSPVSKNIKLMNEWKISANDFVITYPGEYSRLGAIDDVVKAMMQMKDFYKNFKFIFACRIKNNEDFKKKREIKMKLKAKKMLNKVIFTDTYLDMPKLYNLSDIIIFPVRNMKGKFDVPLTIIESMACGKPVIISNLPVLKELVKGQNSVTIESGNTKQLAGAILNLYENKEKREEIGKNARKYAENNFDIKKVAEEYKKVYESL